MKKRKTYSYPNKKIHDSARIISQEELQTTKNIITSLNDILNRNEILENDYNYMNNLIIYLADIYLEDYEVDRLIHNIRTD